MSKSSTKHLKWLSSFLVGLCLSNNSCLASTSSTANKTVKKCFVDITFLNILYICCCLQNTIHFLSYCTIVSIHINHMFLVYYVCVDLFDQILCDCPKYSQSAYMLYTGFDNRLECLVHHFSSFLKHLLFSERSQNLCNRFSIKLVYNFF